MRKILTTAAMVWCYCSVEKNYTEVTLWLLIHAFKTRPNYRPIIRERRQNKPAYIWHHGCEVILCVVRVSSGYTDTQPIIEDSFVAQSIFRSSCSSAKNKKTNKQTKWDKRETSRKEKRGENGVSRNKRGDKTVGGRKTCWRRRREQALYSSAVTQCMWQAATMWCASALNVILHIRDGKRQKMGGALTLLCFLVQRIETGEGCKVTIQLKMMSFFVWANPDEKFIKSLYIQLH